MRLKHAVSYAFAVFFLACSTLLHAAQSPSVVVRDEVDRVLGIVQDENLDQVTRRSKLRDVIANRFDFQAMSQSILAQHWEEATPDQRSRFIDLFKQILERTYIGAIESYTSETVNVGGERIREGKATVIVTIKREDSTDIPLLFKLKRRGETWIAYDANIEGISLVSNYRERFGGIARNKGVTGVLQEMERRLNTQSGA